MRFKGEGWLDALDSERRVCVVGGMRVGVGMEAASQGAGHNKAELSGWIDSVQIIIFPSPRRKQRSGTTGTRY